MALWEEGGVARAGAEERLVTHNLNIRERVLNFHPYLVCHICTKLILQPLEDQSL